MRRIRLALALPILLPLVAVAFARADDAPKPAAPEAPPKPDAKPDAKPEAKPLTPKAEGGIAWLHDYDAAKAKAAEEKKGLFVYLTPSWFVCGYCKKLQAEGYTNADVQRFVGERFVAVQIDDKKDDLFAAKLGLSQEGYPNIAMYDVGGEYLGRVIGFGGRDSWFKQVGDVWKVGEKLAGAKADAEKDPAAWAAYAALVAEIAGREKDALAALEKIPEASRATDYAATHAGIAAKSAWAEVEKGIRASTKDAKTPDDMKKVAPTNLERIEGWLKEHGGANAKTDPAAWARKGSLLVLLERKPEAVEVAMKILKEWPDSPQAQALLRGLR